MELTELAKKSHGMESSGTTVYNDASEGTRKNLFFAVNGRYASRGTKVGRGPSCSEDQNSASGVATSVAEGFRMISRVVRLQVIIA